MNEVLKISLIIPTLNTLKNKTLDLFEFLKFNLWDHLNLIHFFWDFKININDVIEDFCGEFPPFCEHGKGHRHQQKIKIFLQILFPYMANSQNMVKFSCGWCWKELQNWKIKIWKNSLMSLLLSPFIIHSYIYNLNSSLDI